MPLPSRPSLPGARVGSRSQECKDYRVEEIPVPTRGEVLDAFRKIVQSVKETKG